MWQIQHSVAVCLLLFILVFTYLSSIALVVLFLSLVFLLGLFRHFLPPVFNAHWTSLQFWAESLFYSAINMYHQSNFFNGHQRSDSESISTNRIGLVALNSKSYHNLTTSNNIHNRLKVLRQYSSINNYDLGETSSQKTPSKLNENRLSCSDQSTLFFQPNSSCRLNPTHHSKPRSHFTPLSSSTFYNADVNHELYVSVTSPGFTGRVAQKASEALTQQPCYAGVGLFPNVQLGPHGDKLHQLTSRNSMALRSPVRVRIAPPQSSFSSTGHDLNRSSEVGISADDSMKSVLQVLKDISRKRIHTPEDGDEDEIVKRQRKVKSCEEEMADDETSPTANSDYNVVGKRMREDSPTRDNDEVKRQRRHQQTCNNEISSSLSSSLTIRPPHLTNKRKAAQAVADQSYSNTTDNAGKHFKAHVATPSPEPVKTKVSDMDAFNMEAEATEIKETVEEEASQEALAVGSLSGPWLSENSNSNDDPQVFGLSGQKKSVAPMMDMPESWEEKPREFKGVRKPRDKLLSLFKILECDKVAVGKKNVENEGSSDDEETRVKENFETLLSTFSPPSALPTHRPSILSPGGKPLEKRKSVTFCEPISKVYNAPETLPSSLPIETVSSTSIVQMIVPSSPIVTYKEWVSRPSEAVEPQNTSREDITKSTLNPNDLNPSIVTNAGPPLQRSLSSQTTTLSSNCNSSDRLLTQTTANPIGTTVANVKLTNSTGNSFISPLTLNSTLSEKPGDFSFSDLRSSQGSSKLEVAPTQTNAAFTFGGSIASASPRSDNANQSTLQFAGPKAAGTMSPSFSFGVTEGKPTEDKPTNPSSLANQNTFAPKTSHISFSLAASTFSSVFSSPNAKPTSEKVSFSSEKNFKTNAESVPLENSVSSKSEIAKTFSFGLNTSNINGLNHDTSLQSTTKPAFAMSKTTADNTVSSVHTALMTSSQPQSNGLIFSQTSAKPTFSFGSSTAAPTLTSSTLSISASAVAVTNGPYMPASNSFTTTTTLANGTVFGSSQSKNQSEKGTNAVCPIAVVNPATAFGSCTGQSSLFSKSQNDNLSFGTPKTAPLFSTTSATLSFAPSFGASQNPTPSFDSSRNSTPSFVASQNVTPSFGTAQNPTPSFRASQNPTPTFGASQNLATSFGTSQNATPSFAASQNVIPSFGTSQNPTTSFGASLNTTQSFGTSLNTSPSFVTSQNTTPSFGTSQNVTPSFGTSQNATPLFGAPQITTPSFGTSQTETPAFGAAQNVLPSFGNSQSASTVFGTTQRKTLTFGAPQNKTPIFGAMPNPTVSFGGTPQNAPPAFGTVTTITPAVPAFVAQPTQNSTPFAFGGATTTSSAFTFGASSIAQLPTTSVSSFTAQNELTSSKGFNFGAVSVPGVSAAPSFANPLSAQTQPAFQFNSGTNPQPANGGFSFGGASTTPVFGAAAAVPVAPNFQIGGTAPAAAGMFSIGSGGSGMRARTARPVRRR